MKKLNQILLSLLVICATGPMAFAGVQDAASNYDVPTYDSMQLSVHGHDLFSYDDTGALNINVGSNFVMDNQSPMMNFGITNELKIDAGMANADADFSFNLMDTAGVSYQQFLGDSRGFSIRGDVGLGLGVGDATSFAAVVHAGAAYGRMVDARTVDLQARDQGAPGRAGWLSDFVYPYARRLGDEQPQKEDLLGLVVLRVDVEEALQHAPPVHGGEVEPQVLDAVRRDRDPRAAVARSQDIFVRRDQAERLGPVPGVAVGNALGGGLAQRQLNIISFRDRGLRAHGRHEPRRYQFMSVRVDEMDVDARGAALARPIVHGELVVRVGHEPKVLGRVEGRVSNRGAARGRRVRAHDSGSAVAPHH